MVGPDHFASIEPDELKTMVKGIRNVENAFGSKRKKITEEEKKNIYFMRRSVHAAKNLKKGEIINEGNIKIIRPFDGVEPWFLDMILSKELKFNVNKDEPINWDCLI
jgi:sialic acid synthase SpsE